MTTTNNNTTTDVLSLIFPSLHLYLLITYLLISFLYLFPFLNDILLHFLPYFRFLNTFLLTYCFLFSVPPILLSKFPASSVVSFLTMFLCTYVFPSKIPYISPLLVHRHCKIVLQSVSVCFRRQPNPGEVNLEMEDNESSVRLIEPQDSERMNIQMELNDPEPTPAAHSTDELSLPYIFMVCVCARVFAVKFNS